MVADIPSPQLKTSPLLVIARECPSEPLDEAILLMTVPAGKVPIGLRELWESLLPKPRRP